MLCSQLITVCVHASNSQKCVYLQLENMCRLLELVQSSKQIFYFKSLALNFPTYHVAPRPKSQDSRQMLLVKRFKLFRLLFPKGVCIHIAIEGQVLESKH